MHAAHAAARELRARLALEAPSLRVLDARDVGRPGIHALDSLRLAVAPASCHPGLTGYAAAEQLAAAGVTPELVAPRCLLFVCGIGTSSDDVRRLVAALAALRPPAHGPDSAAAVLPLLPPPPPLAMAPRAALFARREAVPAARAIGRVSAETLCPYPPGVPLAFAGSLLTAEALAYLRAVLAAGGAVTGGADSSCATLQCVVEADVPASLWDPC